MKIVVAGGTGFLGAPLVAALRHDGHEVTVLTRKPTRGGEVRWIPGAAPAAGLLAGADAVINLAGTSIAEHRWTAAQKAAIRTSRLDATRTLASAITELRPPPRVFISGSAVGYYGDQDDRALDEHAPAGSDFLASVCREWEAEAMTAAGATRVVLLRTGLALGTGGGALPQLALPFRLLAGGPLGSGRQYMSWIHRDDWVSLVRWALVTETVSGGVNGTAPEPVTNAEFARTLGRVLHRPAFLPTPALALRLALGEMADALILGGQRVMPSAALARGFRFEYPVLEPALREILG